MLTRKALDRLPAQQREIVLGIIWEQKSEAVIAKELGLPPWKVSREFAAALAALRENLDGA
jgi:DNA-directed RNA polymerase specialized sigma24 family protein